MTKFGMTWVVLFGAFALGNLIAGTCAWLLWPLVRQATKNLRAATAARVLFVWRALPTAGAIGLSVLATAAFLEFEPANAAESPGLLLLCQAAIGLLLAIGSGVRLLGAAASTWRLRRTWRESARQIAVPRAALPVYVVESEFPVAAVVGFHRPDLVVSRAVAERCTTGELAAIAAHENGHVQAGDNLRRLMLTVVCDSLSWTRRGTEMVTAWQDAAEEAADDHASASGARELDLASALVTVSRLAVPRVPSMWGTSVLFYRGSGIEHRVRRLLGRPHVDRPAPSRTPGLAFGAASASLMLLAVGLATSTPGQAIHAAAEWFVQRLP